MACAIHPTLYLASRSPRRRELLEQMGLAYTLVDVEVDETPDDGESPERYVVRVALDKAATALGALDDNLDDNLDDTTARVLAADTAVVLDGTPLGKPTDPADALTMLAALSGRTHRVLTGVVLATSDGTFSTMSESHVRFRRTTPEERSAYVATGEPLDKAGAYAIQGRAAVFIEHLEGSYSGVMGLPVFETAELLRRVGIDVFTADPATQTTASPPP